MAKIILLLFVAIAFASPAGAQPVAAKEALAEARRLGQAFSAVAEDCSQFVVSIRVESKQRRAPGGMRFFGVPFSAPEDDDADVARGAGSGFIIRADGAILTNRHVVQGATRIEVVLRDGRKLTGTVVGSDEATDLAVVRIAAKDLPTAAFADPTKARVGEWVIAIGSPFGLDYTVTAGVLSAIGRGGLGANEIEDYLQTDASINPGNSGGPLVNLSGEVLGINTMIIGKGTGIGFAIPADIGRAVADQLIAHGTVQRAWIGVGFQELTPELAQGFGATIKGGALVGSVVAEGPAAKAGIQPGDIITEIGGQPVKEGRDLLRAVLRRKVGDAIPVKLLRKGQTVTKQITTAQRPTDESRNGSAPREAQAPVELVPEGYGLQLQELTPKLARQLGISDRTHGVLVTAVKHNSTGERAGIQRGDVIVEVDQKPVVTLDQLTKPLATGRALLRVLRHDNAFYVVLEREP